MLLCTYNIFCRQIKLGEAAVLHYTYAKFSDLTSRRDRCNCKPTKEDLQRCFMLEFDRVVSCFSKSPSSLQLQIFVLYALSPCWIDDLKF